MGKKTKIVVAESGISAGQMKDFWRMVDDHTINGNIFSYILQNIKEIAKKAGERLTLARVINILGQDKILQSDIICKKWKLSIPKTVVIRYSEKTIRECANENKAGKALWHLVYYPGISLLRQREFCGIDAKKPPYFSKENDWWLEAEKESCQKERIPYWPEKSPTPGFYLIDMKSRFANINWQAQEDKIVNPKYERTNETVFLFSAISIFMLTGKNIIFDWWHWGSSVGSSGYYVSVRLFSNGMTCVNVDHLSRFGGNLRISVSRKFDF